MCLASQFFYSAFNVVDKPYRQVLTPVNNSQLLLKLEILDKFRLVTNHKNTSQRKLQHFLVHTGTGETGVLMTLNHRASMHRCSQLAQAIVFTLMWDKL